ncbi:MAG: hypothetical protein ISR61_03785 [Desulfobacteraceae bacterium]|nr:hypothetical protein [Desulfobacteraceae bacterium]
MWEDFRQGLALGTGRFVDLIKKRYPTGRPHREIPRQRGVVGRVNTEEVIKKASGLFNCDTAGFKEKDRLYGKDKRDLLVFFLWEGELITTGKSETCSVLPTRLSATL